MSFINNPIRLKKLRKELTVYTIIMMILFLIYTLTMGWGFAKSHRASEIIEINNTGIITVKGRTHEKIIFINTQDNQSYTAACIGIWDFCEELYNKQASSKNIKLLLIEDTNSAILNMSVIKDGTIHTINNEYNQEALYKMMIRKDRLYPFIFSVLLLSFCTCIILISYRLSVLGKQAG